ncbi:HAD superfamily hydrolase Cof domain-containing protein [Mycoplasmoides gallisepticum]|uniref:HAD superfamily hydrolase Cof domain-containing protein n=1 Tax=Mycoplasmoides gallisepticum TaxID=2096 RepID=A0A3B0PM05_MYCGL|nr:HAD superfamily hydrolase Cof domain-containing protein [Mycoplasmoides gallisepticum]
MYFRTYLIKTKSSKKSNYTKLASLPYFRVKTVDYTSKPIRASIFF